MGEKVATGDQVDHSSQSSVPFLAVPLKLTDHLTSIYRCKRVKFPSPHSLEEQLGRLFGIGFESVGHRCQVTDAIIIAGSKRRIRHDGELAKVTSKVLNLRPYQSVPCACPHRRRNRIRAGRAPAIRRRCGCGTDPLTVRSQIR